MDSISKLDKIITYFKNKQIDVSFNTLGATDKLIQLYIKENKNLVKGIAGQTSNHVKHACYNRYYEIESRPKYTGFEKFQHLDKITRKKMFPLVPGLVGVPELEIVNDDSLSGSYIDELKAYIKGLKDPLLYLSGGVDSEFVALVMLEVGIKFTPVILQWVNDSDKVCNIHDFLYAFDFCEKHKLTPIINKINLEKLWNNPEFIELARETCNNSPQVNTYVYAVELMAEKYPNSTHVLGGEVRFRTIINEEQETNYVSALKTSVPAYDGYSFTFTENAAFAASTGVVAAYSGANKVGIKLVYNYNGDVTSNQTWTVYGISNTANVTPTANTLGATSGTWFNGTPPPHSNNLGFEYSTNNGVTWTTMNSGSGALGDNVIYISTRSSTAADESTGNAQTVNVKVRNKASPQITVSANITLNWAYDYTPTYMYDTGWVTGASLPITNVNGTVLTKLSLAMCGGAGGGGYAYIAPSSSTAEGAGGGGAAGSRDSQNDIDVTGLTSIGYTLGQGGVGGTSGSPNGSNGNGSSYTIGVSTFNLTGGGGGATNSVTTSSSAGSGGNNSNYFGGAGYTSGADAVGGGGAGSNGNGSAGSAGGAGGGSQIVTLTKNSILSSSSIIFGAGGAGGTGNSTANGASGAAKNGGGGGLARATNPSTAAANGGAGGNAAWAIYY